MQILNSIINIATMVITVATIYQTVYLLIGFFSPRCKYKPTDKKYNYAAIICARNEENVIGKLVESIKNQTYDGSKITVFVCADNCTDRTAEICRQAGCIVYERPAPPAGKARKGFALEFLFDNIAADYGISTFDGYAFFDADNVLAPDWFEKMNNAFDTDAGIITTYRNTKNFDTNFISASYGIHFYRSTVKLHRARRRLTSSTHIAGTGYTVKSRLLEGGWHFTELTEDTQFTEYIVSKGEIIAFCEDAEFFDEQPHNVKVMLRQRLRWSRGRLVVFIKNGWRSIAGIFTCKGLRRKWSNYDMFWYVFPAALFSAALAVVSAVAGLIAGLVSGTAGTAAADAISSVSSGGFYLKILYAFLVSYASSIITACLVLIREHRHIYCAKWKQAIYVFTFFWFDILNVPLTVLAAFMPVKWKPIVHDKSFDYNEIINKR